MYRERQTRIEFPASQRNTYMNCTIWQPETKRTPWTVHCEGWTDGNMNIWLYHEGIKNGYHFYSKCRFKSARHFAEFMRQQLTMFKNVFNKNIDIRGIDFRALFEGYEKGVKRARSYTIGNQPTNER